MISDNHRNSDPSNIQTTITQDGLLAGLTTLNVNVELNTAHQQNDLRRQRRLAEFRMLCNLSKELSTSDPQDALLDRLARHAVELTNVQFSKIISRDSEGAFICQAQYDISAGNIHHRETPPASWPHYHQILRSKTPIEIRRSDSSIGPNTLKALELDRVPELWVLPLWAGTEPVGIFVLGELSEKIQGAYQGSDRTGLMTNIADQATIGLQRKKLNESLEKSFIDIILALAETIEVGDSTPMRHSNQTARVSDAIALRLNMCDSQLKAVRWAGLLHDIGKVQVPEEILRKPGPLTPVEWEIMRQHPLIGAELLAPVSRFQDAIPMIVSHHEKFNGSGYPYGLKGEEIPLGGRILAVADAYSAMLCGRVYCQPFSLQQTVSELIRCKGSHFDPAIVDTLVLLIEEGYQF